MVSCIVKLKMTLLCVSLIPYVILFCISVMMSQQRVIWVWEKLWRESGSGTGDPEFQFMFVNMFYLAFTVSYINNQTGKPFGLLQPIPPPSSCFESVVVDHLGPFKQTTWGNQHIIVAIDTLSKHVEIAAVPDTTAEKSVEFLANNVVYTHSCPVRIISDQGTAFTAKFTADAMEGWSIRQVFATGEDPQTFVLI